MNNKPMKFQNICILGAGTIGLSWTALFAATGRNVVVYDPAPDTWQRLEQFIDAASKTLTDLGWSKAGNMEQIKWVSDPADAVKNADFIQESIPERIELKHALYAAIEPNLKANTIIGSSTSGLKLSDLQAGFQNPEKLILAHPFNPPHLIPLVEVMGNDKTDNEALQEAINFYESIGKTCVRLNKEVKGHIANRLQAAIWREAINLADQGVASISDIDKAVAFGPGLRWAAFGPTTLFSLGGGDGGIRAFCEHLGEHVEAWWNDLGKPDLTPSVVDKLEKEMQQVLTDKNAHELVEERDKLVLQYLLARTNLKS